MVLLPSTAAAVVVAIAGLWLEVGAEVVLVATSARGALPPAATVVVTAEVGPIVVVTRGATVSLH